MNIKNKERKILNCASYPVTQFWKNQKYIFTTECFCKQIRQMRLFIFCFCQMARNSYFLSYFLLFFYRLFGVQSVVQLDVSQSNEQKGV